MGIVGVYVRERRVRWALTEATNVVPKDGRWMDRAAWLDHPITNLMTAEEKQRVLEAFDAQNAGNADEMGEHVGQSV